MSKIMKKEVLQRQKGKQRRMQVQMHQLKCNQGNQGS